MKATYAFATQSSTMTPEGLSARTCRTPSTRRLQGRIVFYVGNAVLVEADFRRLTRPLVQVLEKE